MRVLVVEDDVLLGQGIRAGLTEAGLAVDWVRDGLEAKAALDAGDFGAVVLDLGLPRMSGMDLLSGMRRSGDRTPVLVLTARDAIGDRVRGLDAGADDYMIKPFDFEELCARLRAIARRAGGDAAPVLQLADLSLDPAAHKVVFREREVDLSVREFALLHELMLAAGRVLTRENLIERVYAWGEEVESNAIEVHVHHLRRKLAPELIRTVRGVGYLMPRPDKP